MMGGEHFFFFSARVSLRSKQWVNNPRLPSYRPGMPCSPDALRDVGKPAFQEATRPQSQSLLRPDR